MGAEVKWGFFGNLEVFSVEAFNTLLDNIDSCSQKIDWVKGTKFGPIGEDLFAQMCMDRKLRPDHRWGVPRHQEEVGCEERHEVEAPMLLSGYTCLGPLQKTRG